VNCLFEAFDLSLLCFGLFDGSSLLSFDGKNDSMPPLIVVGFEITKEASSSL